jgi:hypothetical protein
MNPDTKDPNTKVDQSTEKDATHVALGETHDIGANLYLEAEQLTAEELEIEGAEVLKIIDWRIMPLVSYDSDTLRVTSDSDIALPNICYSIPWYAILIISPLLYN